MKNLVTTHFPEHLIRVLVGLALLCPAFAACADPPGWDLVWEDNFDTLDTDRWRIVNTNVTTNNSLQDYLPEQVSVADGKLEILAEDEPSRGLPYRSGQIISHAEQKYGRWEVHAKLPTTTGMWPAIWLLPDTTQVNWPSGGEIDIMEFRGNEPTVTSSAFHYGTNPPYSHSYVYDEQQTRVGGQLVDYSADYHTFAVDWTEHHLRFYVDGVHYYTVFNSDVGGFVANNTAPMQLVINNAIGGHFLPNPDSTTQWPQTMHIDWVRVYEESANPDPIPFANPSFETNGGTLAGWSTFGNDLVDNPNVVVTGEAVADGASSLKIFGPFSGATTYSGVSQGVSVATGDQVSASLEAMVRSQDSLVGTNNLVTMKIEFYSVFGGKFGSPEMLGVEEIQIANGGVQEDVWQTHTINAVAPAGATEARIAVVFTQPGQAGGAIHIDSTSLNVATAAAAFGDFNADGVVDAADYTVWRDSEGSTGHRLSADATGDGVVDQLDYNVWQQQFGSRASASVPEPSALAVCVPWLAAVLASRSAPW